MDVCISNHHVSVDLTVGQWSNDVGYLKQKGRIMAFEELIENGTVLAVSLTAFVGAIGGLLIAVLNIWKEIKHL